MLIEAAPLPDVWVMGGMEHGSAVSLCAVRIAARFASVMWETAGFTVFGKVGWNC